MFKHSATASQNNSLQRLLYKGYDTGHAVRSAPRTVRWISKFVSKLVALLCASPCFRFEYTATTIWSKCKNKWINPITPFHPPSIKYWS